MDGTTTLADALLDDLDDLDDNYDENNENDHTNFHNHNNDDNAELVRMAAVGDNDDWNNNNMENDDDNRNGTTINITMKNDNVIYRQNNNMKDDGLYPRFVDDSAFQEYLQIIRTVRSSSTTTATSNANGDDEKQKNQQQQIHNNKNPIKKFNEHQLLVQSNKYLSHLHNYETIRVYKKICNLYSHKFPELVELIPNIYQYVQVIRCIWNEMDITNCNNEQLSTIVTNNQMMTLSISGSTTSGRPLGTTELKQLEIYCTYIEELFTIQKEMEHYIESQMEQIAPNLCSLVNSTSIVSKLISLAGGLYELSKIPSCNIQILGQTKHTSSLSKNGLSTTTSTITQPQQQQTHQYPPHTGILMECDIIQHHCPRMYHRKALKIIAAKVALAARHDYAHFSTGSSTLSPTNTTTEEVGDDVDHNTKNQYGIQLRNEIMNKIKIIADPYHSSNRTQTIKALPKPDMNVKKRRGGKRMRRLKERYEETKLMKNANTRAFSTQTGEYGDDAMGLTLGLLDAADATGAVRKGTGEIKKMKYANTRQSRKQQQQQQQKSSSGVATSGLATSMVFTPVQGMELVNPDNNNSNKQRVKDANRMWFNENAGFQSSLGKNNSTNK